jgi:hypothetical protein
MNSQVMPFHSSIASMRGRVTCITDQGIHRRPPCADMNPTAAAPGIGRRLGWTAYSLVLAWMLIGGEASSFSASLQARWFDPVSGHFTAIAGGIENQGEIRLSPPAKGDWVLLLQKANR